MKTLILFLLLVVSPSISKAELPKVKNITAGFFHACALFESGKVKCWGENEHGQLGYGDQSNRGDNGSEMGKNLKYLDLGENLKVKQVSPGDRYTCALFESGQVKCWGKNYYGQLGYGDTEHRGDNPNEMGVNLKFVDLGSEESVVHIAAGDRQSCALFENGKVKCWGVNDDGQLGYGDTESRGDDPNEMGENLKYINFGLKLKVVQLSVGYSHNCVLFESGKVKCWGWNRFGALGYGDVENRGDDANEMGENLPYVDLGKNLIVHKIYASGQTTCAQFTNIRIKCWGDNDYGELGYGDTMIRGDNANEMGKFLKYLDFGALSEYVTEFSSGVMSNCVKFINNTIKCWGYGAYGQLGHGNSLHIGDSIEETGESMLTLKLPPVKSITSGWCFRCVILQSEKIKCWGYGKYGQLGYPFVDYLGDDPNETVDLLPYIELF